MGKIERQELGSNLKGELNGYKTHLAVSPYNPKFYGAVYDGVADDTQAILDCIADMPVGATLQITGNARYTSSLVFNKLVHIEGLTSTPYAESPYRAKSCLIKDGNFNGVVLNFEGSSIENIQIDSMAGNGGCGLVLGGSRIKVKNVSTTNHGNHGIDIGSVGSNWNMWSLENIISLNNGGYGVNIDDIINVQQNCNAGCFVSADLRDNTLGGLALGKTIDNIFIGISSQVNGGYGVELKNGAQGNQFFGTYTEGNAVGELVLQTGANKNYVFGYRSGVNSDGITDNGTANFILGRDNQIDGGLPYLKSKVGFKELVVENPALSGYWKFIENASDRALELSMEGTSATPIDLRVKHNNGGKVNVKFDTIYIGGTNKISGCLTGSGSLNFGSVSSNSTKDVTMTIAGCVEGNRVVATPGSLAEGLDFCAFVSAPNTVTVRVGNKTVNPITAGTIAFYVSVWQH